jgi:hypothetical protein
MIIITTLFLKARLFLFFKKDIAFNKITTFARFNNEIIKILMI